MKEIQLSQGKVAICDDSDFDWLSKMKWTLLHKYAAHWYRDRETKKVKMTLMHRMILGMPDGMEVNHKRMEVDHINGKSLDNRRENLRMCTRSQNAQHRHTASIRPHTSRFRGVCYASLHQKWQSYIQVNYHQIHLGLFASEFDAARAYNAAALKYHGEFASLNNLVEAAHA